MPYPRFLVQFGTNAINSGQKNELYKIGTGAENSGLSREIRDVWSPYYKPILIKPIHTRCIFKGQKDN